MEEDVILKVDHLSHRYSAAWALRNVSFEVRKHDICGLLGPNGAGKSTVMNIICGIVRQSDGKVSVAGIDVLKHPLEAKAHIGFLAAKIRRYTRISRWRSICGMLLRSAVCRIGKSRRRWTRYWSCAVSPISGNGC